VTRGLGRAIAAGVLGATVAAAWVALFYAVRPVLRIDFATDPPRLVSGVYPPERDDAAGVTFAWTGEELALRLPGIDRRVDWILEVRVRGARPNAQDNPDLTFFADGVPILTRHSETDFDNVRVTIPANAARRRGALIAMRASRTFVPGPGDTRALGVMLDWLALRPAGVVLAPPVAFAGAVIGGAALGAAVAALGVTAGSAVGAAVLLSAAEASILARGFGPYTTFPMTAATLAVWLALALTVLAGAVQYWRRQPLRNTARFAAAVSLGALFLKLLVLLHPDMPIGDTLFHAHRFQDVLAGKLYFTSIAPGNYTFPYAPGLYVFAAAFARTVRRGLADMALLRIIVCSVDALAGVLLYSVVVRARADRLAAAMAVALYQLVPLDFGIVTTGNMTNAFAQSLSVFALVALTARWLRWEHRSAVLLVSALFAMAFMSHTSTFAILTVTIAAAAVLFWWRGGPALRSPAAAIAAALLLAVAGAIALYYGHFLDTYRTQLARIGAETATAAPDAGGRGIAERLLAVARYLGLYFGWGMLALAGWGAWRLWRLGLSDRLTLTLAAWTVSCVAFLVLGVLTPVDMRYYLAAIPAVAVTAAIGASAGWAAGGASRLVSAALLSWCVFTGVHNWWSAL
jgi:hypothetical protein